ncbi:MAG: C4-dicarboxylate ABC transporter [Deltaproteobacteria bacterium RIFCSPLOWO2_02_FULL_44_10]|nr:MAG: C4-dicarboxylate ABC transporter [Deltaproteobacteria bacterium RIFCSPHIGHO2_02_FULL_44_16]OGQ45535.1 MAG: C4-dicarboxylate ABC transporter [Deltaproteobacteria bacterium RIFCSPLOWO2_02_FULL_44_10]
MTSTTFFVLGLLLCAFCGAPLFVVIGGLALVFFLSVGIDSSAVVIEMYRMASAPMLIAIPLFTFAGYLLAESKSPQRFVNLYRALFGWMPGGLAIVSFIACAFFTAFTGASGVTIIALGGLLYPMLIKEKYSEKFSLGLLTTGGSLGLLFPPSLPLILYALVAQVNVDALFLAGIIPGTLLILFLSLYSILRGQVSRVQREKPEWGKIKKAVCDAIWILPLPAIVLGGIYGGIFTASEAAAVTVAYVFIVELCIYRDLKLFRDVPRIVSESMVLVGSILMILACALGLTNYLVDEQVPMKILEVMRQYITSKVTFLIMLNLFLLVVGCLMDIFSAIIVVVPLLLPIAKEFGIHPLHLGIIFLTNLEIGYSTPPVGLNLFISSYRFKKKIPELCKASLPFLAVLLLALLIITYVPDLSLFLVRMFGLE